MVGQDRGLAEAVRGGGTRRRGRRSSFGVVVFVFGFFFFFSSFFFSIFFSFDLPDPRRPIPSGRGEQAAPQRSPGDAEHGLAVAAQGGELVEVGGGGRGGGGRGRGSLYRRRRSSSIEIVVVPHRIIIINLLPAPPHSHHLVLARRGEQVRERVPQSTSPQGDVEHA